MRKIIITNGLIAGIIVSAMFFVTYPLMKNGSLNTDSGMLVGYASMVIALSTIFFGIKTYRDQYQEGAISFGRAFRIGILITLLACVIYAITWEICYHTIASDFNEFYAQCEIDKLEKKGASAAEIEAKRVEIMQSLEMFKNPVVRFTFTALVEMFPVGLIVTLISAAILRKKEILPA